MFKKATKEQARLRVAIDGPAKSGKTYTALTLAEAVVNRFGGRIALIDTERGSASKYANRFDFDVAELDDFHPEQFIKAITAATPGNTYSVLVIDSLSHEWMGERGILQLVDQAQSKSKNQFAAWRVPSGLHTKLIDTMLQAPVHLIATMRSKMEYVQVEERGKMVPKKVGLKPVQRDGIEYEFDVLVSLDIEHQASISGSRCPEMDGKSENRPGGDFFKPLLDWVSDGAEPKTREEKPIRPANGNPIPTDYPASISEMMEWAQGEPFNFTKERIRAAIEAHLCNENESEDRAPTPEEFKEEMGETEAVRFFWEAILAAWHAEQKPEPDEIPF